MARGLIAVQSELQAKAGAGRDIQMPTDDGIAQALAGRGGAAESLGRIGSRIGEMADHAAQKEGEASGRQAGLDPEFRTRQDLTIRGEAFDKAGLQVSETRLKTALDNGLQQVFDKHKNSPKELAVRLDEVAAGVLRGAPEELAPKLQMSFSSQRLAYMRDADRLHVARVRSEQSGALVDELTRLQRGIHQRAYALGLDPEADKAVAGDLAQLRATLNRTGIDGNRLVSPEQASRMIRGAEIETTNARLSGAMGRLQTAQEKSLFIRQLEDDFGKSAGVAKVYDLSEFEQIRNRLETDLRRTLAEERQGAAVIGRQIESIAKRAEKGVPPTPDELGQVRAMVATSSDPAVHAAFDDAQAQLEWQRHFRSLPLGQVEQTVQAMRQREQVDGATPREVARREQAERMLSSMTSELKSNPLAWDDKVGIIKMQPIDPSTTETLIGSAQLRVVQAEQAATRHGLAKPVYLQPVEARSLSKAFSAGGEQGLAVAEAITKGFGDRASAVFEEIGKHGPATSLIGKLYVEGGKSKGVVDAAEGLHLVSLPGYKRLAPERAKTRDIVVSETRGAYTGFEEDISAASAVADLIYEKRAFAAKATQFDDRVWRQAFREAIGERKANGATWGGIVDQGWWDRQAIVLPTYVRQDRWRDVVQMITPADLEAAGLGKPTGRDGKEVALSRIKSGRLIQESDGRFAISTAGGEQVDVMRDGKTGQPFLIDLTKLAPILRRRRPDLFDGADQ